jgi:hypothetical protein
MAWAVSRFAMFHWLTARAAAGPKRTSAEAIDSQRCTSARVSASRGNQALPGAYFSTR